jgi:hypothetical protein
MATSKVLGSCSLYFTELQQSQVLHQTRFLKIEEVVGALEFYEGLVRKSVPS